MLSTNERERLDALREYRILDTDPEKDFDEIVELASFICGTPISTITLIDENRQWFKAQVGLDNRETPRDVSFCAHAILEYDIMIVNDATQDERFFDNPLVTGKPDIRFYAGLPLTTGRGLNLGTLCVIDTKPRTLTTEQSRALHVLRNQLLKLFELRRTNLQLERTHELQEKLLSIIGHDLRGPMGSIAGLISMREEFSTIEDFKECLYHVDTKFRDINTLLVNLLEWARRNIEGKHVAPQQFNLLKLTKEICAPLLVGFIEKQNSLSIDVPGDLSITIDKNAFSFVLRNLVANANKFTDRGKIEVSATAIDEGVEIKVADSGVGIEPDRVREIFIWASRVNTKGTRGEMGSGLGLPMVKEFVEVMNGSISCEPGEVGTVFTVRLPV